MELHEEGRAELDEDGPLVLGVLELVLVEDDLFVQHLHGVHLVGAPVLHLQHLAVGAATDDRDQVKVVHLHLAGVQLSRRRGGLANREKK